MVLRAAFVPVDLRWFFWRKVKLDVTVCINEVWAYFVGDTDNAKLSAPIGWYNWSYGYWREIKVNLFGLILAKKRGRKKQLTWNKLLEICLKRKHCKEIDSFKNLNESSLERVKLVFDVILKGVFRQGTDMVDGKKRKLPILLTSLIDA